MKHLIPVVLILLIASPGPVNACGDHLYLDPEKMGFLGGAMVRMAGLAPPKPTFEISHPTMVQASVGNKNQLEITYERPFFSKHVQLEVSGSENVKGLQSVYPLEERSGTVSIPYEITQAGVDTITLVINGQYKGETARQVSRIYVRAVDNKPQSKQSSS